MSNASTQPCQVQDCNRERGRHGGLGMCRLHYDRAKAGRPLNPEPKPVYAHCTVGDCEKPTRSAHSPLCEMHYHRQYRHGDVNQTAHEQAPTASHGRRYKTVYDPKHPLAGKWGQVYVHRRVLYDAIGPGYHPCHWCSTPVRFAAKGTSDALIPDHLNNVGDDNRIENLAPSCVRCNTARAAYLKRQALKDAGWFAVNDTVALTGGGRREPLPAWVAA
jgi:hypothetical protein